MPNNKEAITEAIQVAFSNIYLSALGRDTGEHMNLVSTIIFSIEYLLTLTLVCCWLFTRDNAGEIHALKMPSFRFKKKYLYNESILLFAC